MMCVHGVGVFIVVVGWMSLLRECSTVCFDGLVDEFA